MEENGRIGWGIVRPVFFASSTGPALSGGSHVCFAANAIPAPAASSQARVGRC